MQLFLPAYDNLQAIRTQKAAKTERRARELMGELEEEKKKLRDLEMEMDVLREAIRRKTQGRQVSTIDSPPSKTPLPRFRAVASRLSSLSPTIRGEPGRIATHRLNQSLEDPGKLFQSMYTKDYFPKKNFQKNEKGFGRAKDKLCAYREHLHQCQHVLRK